MAQDMCVQQGKAGTLKVEIYPDSQSAGAAAAQAAAAALRALAAAQDTVAVIFATGASQLNTLGALTATPGLPWGKVRGFHLDEYIGLPATHPASFRRYLRENLTSKVALQSFHELDGTATDIEGMCRAYAAALRSEKPQLCLLGIGENGHLAFNDPWVADFKDPLDVKMVELDLACQQQQVAEGWFAGMDDVPSHAVTLTIPALFRVPQLIASVPGSRKAEIVRRTLTEPISVDVPATLLRTHPNATLYLNQESAAELEPGILS